MYRMLLYSIQWNSSVTSCNVIWNILFHVGIVWVFHEVSVSWGLYRILPNLVPVYFHFCPEPRPCIVFPCLPFVAILDVGSSGGVKFSTMPSLTRVQVFYSDQSFDRICVIESILKNSTLVMRKGEIYCFFLLICPLSKVLCLWANQFDFQQLEIQKCFCILYQSMS